MYMTPDQIEDFFKKYLAIYGLEGGHCDFIEMNTHFLHGRYEDCFQRKWPIDRRYGYSTYAADIIRRDITLPNNYLAAIKSYKDHYNLK